jgi:hypothetical protein
VLVTTPQGPSVCRYACAVVLNGSWPPAPPGCRMYMARNCEPKTAQARSRGRSYPPRRTPPLGREAPPRLHPAGASSDVAPQTSARRHYPVIVASARARLPHRALFDKPPPHGDTALWPPIRLTASAAPDLSRCEVGGPAGLYSPPQFRQYQCFVAYYRVLMSHERSTSYHICSFESIVLFLFSTETLMFIIAMMNKLVDDNVSSIHDDIEECARRDSAR